MPYFQIQHIGYIAADKLFPCSLEPAFLCAGGIAIFFLLARKETLFYCYFNFDFIYLSFYGVQF